MFWMEQTLQVLIGKTINVDVYSKLPFEKEIL